MTPERKAQLKELRQKLANLSPEQKQAIANKGIIANLDGHVLSLHNSILVHLQANGSTPTIVAGYQQWKRAGKQVRKGQHGYTIWFPAGPKDEEGNITAETFYTATVFDFSQVEPIKPMESAIA